MDRGHPFRKGVEKMVGVLENIVIKVEERFKKIRWALFSVRWNGKEVEEDSEFFCEIYGRKC